MTRYARQIAVPDFGKAAQERLAQARVLVVGAGGLAAPVMPYLAGAGVSMIAVIDPDRVSESNLHRQILFRMADIGSPKAVVLAREMQALNPDVTVTSIVARLDPSNVGQLIMDCDLVLDCADSFAASYTLSDACSAAGIPLIHASVIGTEGYVGGFCGSTPSLRAVFPDLPARLGSCADDGVLGPVVGLVGALQAQMALAVLAGIEPSPMGQLVTVEARGMRFGGFRFDGAEEPDRGRAFIAKDAIRPEDFIVDLRAPEEGPIAHEKARRLSVTDFGADGPHPELGQRAVLVCASGLRAWNAAERLSQSWDGEIALVALGTDEEIET